MNKTYIDIANKWRENKCKGCCILLEPYNPAILIEYIMKRSIEKNPNIKALIVVKDYDVRTRIANYLKENNISPNNYACITSVYVKIGVHYDYDIAFYVGLTDMYQANYINSIIKYGLFIITTDKIHPDSRACLYKYFPILNQADYAAKYAAKYSLPVEEIHIGVQFARQDEKELYDKYSDYINKTINIFGSLENINRARVGDKTTGQSAEAVRLSIAQYNGWNEHLDTTIPFNKQIDDLFNPISIEERCSTAYNIFRERNNLVNNNVNKIPIVIDLLNGELKDKKVIIVSKNTILATEVYKVLNKNNIPCGEFHNDIEARPVYDENVGDFIRYKTGNRKGEVKNFAAQAISSLSVQSFNSNNIRVLSIKNCSSDSLEITCDAIIFMSPNCYNIKEFLYRYNKLTFNVDKIKLYKLYMIGTNEENDCSRLKPINENHEIKNITENEKYYVQSFGSSE